MSLRRRTFVGFDSARARGGRRGVAAVVAGLVLALGASSCGGPADDAAAPPISDVATTTLHRGDEVVSSTTTPATSARSMAEHAGEQPAYVMRGNLYVTGDTASLCTGGAASFPPGCGGPILATVLVDDVVALAPGLADRIIPRGDGPAEYAPDGQPPRVAITFDADFAEQLGATFEAYDPAPGDLLVAADVLAGPLTRGDVVDAYRDDELPNPDRTLTREELRRFQRDLRGLVDEIGDDVPGEFQLSASATGDVVEHPSGERLPADMDAIEIEVVVKSHLTLDDRHRRRILDVVDGRATSISYERYMMPVRE